MNPYREAQGPDVVCPRCELGLATRTIGDVRIDECTSCSGVFVPSTLMPRFLDSLDLGGEVIASFPPGTPSPNPGGPMYVKCPRCRNVMNRRLFAPGAKVVVDVCRGHGIWFDDAELRAVVEFAASGGMARAAKLELEEKRRRAVERGKREQIERDRRVFAAPVAASSTRISLLEALVDMLLGH